jgi:FkbM family methyltransferase
MTASSLVGRCLRATVSVLPPSTASYIQRTLFEIPLLGRGMRAMAASAAKGEGVVTHGPARGLRIDATGTAFSFALGTWGEAEQDLLAEHLRPGDVFYDVGAHIGSLSLLAARLVGPAGHVVAFEPSPENAAQLRRNVDLNGFENITVVEAAVSSRAGLARLDLRREERVKARLVGSAEPRRDGVVSVRTVSLDGWRAEESFPLPSFLKIDVEGAEMAVLHGADEVLRASRPVMLVEVHPTVGPAFAEYLEERLLPLGYRATSLTGGPVPLSDDHFHAVLVPGKSNGTVST